MCPLACCAGAWSLSLSVSRVWRQVNGQESVGKVRVAAENAFAGGDMKKVRLGRLRDE